ncbi:MAG TPA: S9 family peptidase, partial [Rhizobiales bacterium]|nr:S9 family peptidase [Hyphomicrobiales bacterium]
MTSAPMAKKKPHSETHHQITRRDEYAWLRAQNWQEVMRNPEALAPEIRDYLEAENAYTKAWMADTEALQEQIFEEMKGRIKEDDSSVPAKDGEYEYYTRFVTGGQHPLFCRRKTGTEDEQILVDGNALARDKAYFNIRSVAHSPDHARIAYAFDDKGSEFYTIRILDAQSGETLEADIADTNGDPVWGRGGASLYYTRLDANHRPSQVFRHEPGAKRQDRLIYEEADSGFFAGIGAVQSRKFLAIDAHDHQTSEIRLIDMKDPDGEAILVAPRQKGHEYDVEHHGDYLYIRSNWQAEDFRIVRARLDNPGQEHWEDVVPHKPGRLILWHNCTAHHLVRLEREEGLPRLVIRELASGKEHEIAFEEEAYSLGAQEGFEFDTNTLRFSYSSMTTPSQLFDYDMLTRQRVLRKTQEVPSGHEPSDYVTRRVFAPAKDGELVPVSLLYARDMALDGCAPLLLYGYGAYGMSMPAGFSTTILSLVDRGFVYAIAHVRGGMEKGYRWYADGRREHKRNTFTDFIAAGEYLAQQKFTARGRIVA